jgi:hypothetical protein
MAAPTPPPAAEAVGEVMQGPSGFEVTPLSAVVPPGQKAAFQVTFDSDAVGNHQLLLVGKQKLTPPEAQPVLGSADGEAAGSGASGVEAAAVGREQEQGQPQPQQEQEQPGNGELQLQLWPTGDGAAPFQTIFKGEEPEVVPLPDHMHHIILLGCLLATATPSLVHHCTPAVYVV